MKAKKKLPDIVLYTIIILLSSNFIGHAADISNQQASVFKDPEDKNAIYIDKLDGLDWKISQADWNENAIRKILHVFCYGGPATTKQIKKWTEMKPDIAIREILNFKAHNTLISNVQSEGKTGVEAMAAYLQNPKNTSLRKLGEYFISGNAPIKINPKGKGIDVWNLPAQAWLYSTMIRGLNPFKQKIGFFETNNHMSVNLNTEVMERQIFRYYDDIMNAHSEALTYDKIMAKAALSSAIASQYRHRENRYENSQFLGNEDFGREFFQLFFKIKGDYALKDTKQYPPALPEKPLDHEKNNDYHEYTTIRNTARALSGIHIPGMKWPRDMEKVDSVEFKDKFSGGWPDDEIEILGYWVKGKTASQKIRGLSMIAIRHPESLKNLPVYIVRTLADDNLVENGKESEAVKMKLNIIRSIWKSFVKKKDYNLLVFLRMYAISKAFHHPTRYKYLNSIDRYVLVSKMTCFNDSEIPYYKFDWRMSREGVGIFRPMHDVFGAQTGIEASNTSDIFRQAYNNSVQEYWYAGKAYHGNWKNPEWVKDYSKVIPPSFEESGRRVWKVVDVAEWLWKQYIGSTENFGFLERAQIYAFLSTGSDFALFMAGDSWQNPASKGQLEIEYTEEYLKENPDARKKWEDLKRGYMLLDEKDLHKRKQYAEKIGSAINFIIATPYMFVR